MVSKNLKAGIKIHNELFLHGTATTATDKNNVAVAVFSIDLENKKECNVIFHDSIDDTDKEAVVKILCNIISAIQNPVNHE